MTETIVDIEASLTERQYGEFLAAVKERACLTYLAQGSYEEQRGALQANLEAWLRASGQRQAEASAEAQIPQGARGAAKVASASSTGAIAAPPDRSRGLANFANNCYANACFQMLYDMEQLRDFLVDLTVDENITFKERIAPRTDVDAENDIDIHTVNINDGCPGHIDQKRRVIRTVREILVEMKRRSTTTVATAYDYRGKFRVLLSAMNAIAGPGAKKHKYGEQQDAHEFLQRLLTILACIPGFDFTSLWTIRISVFPVGHRQYPYGKRAHARGKDVALMLTVPYILNDSLPSIQACIDLAALPVLGEEGVSHATVYEVEGPYCVILLIRQVNHFYQEGNRTESRQYKLPQPVQDYQEDVIIGDKRLTLKGVVTQLGGLNVGHYVYSHKTGDDWISYNDANPPVKTLNALVDDERPKYGYIFVYDVTRNQPEQHARGAPTVARPEGSITTMQYAAQLYDADEAKAKAEAEAKAEAKAKAKTKGKK